MLWKCKSSSASSTPSSHLAEELCSVMLWLFAAPWTVAWQAPLSLGFSGKNTGWHCLPRGSSWPRDWTRVSCFGRQILYRHTKWEAPGVTLSRNLFFLLSILAHSLFCASIATWTYIYHNFPHIVINYNGVCFSHHTIALLQGHTCYPVTGSVVSPFKVCFHHRQPPGQPTINGCSSWGFQVPISSARLRTTLMY